MDEKFAKWKGIGREKISWNPTIDGKKCTGCGFCATSCGRKVFGYDYKKNKAFVKNPLQCMIGCSSCENWCPYGAISFPKREYVRKLILENGLVKKSRDELNEKKDELK